MKKTLLLIVPVIGLIGFSFFDKEANLIKFHNDGIETVNFSANPPAEKTGAPGEGNCTQCHSGATQSAAGNVDYTFSGTADEYLPGQSYTITLDVPMTPKNGFEMTILDGSDNAAGTFTAGTNSATTTANSREYIRHSSSSGVTGWSFTWNAPATDMGDLTVYYAYNETNDDGSTSGDIVYLGQETISISGGVGLTKHELLDSDYNVVFNQMTKDMTVTYKPIDNSVVVLNIQDLSGRLVKTYDFGQKGPSNQKEIINLSHLNQSGVYIVSIFIGNQVLNRKVYLG